MISQKDDSQHHLSESTPAAYLDASHPHLLSWGTQSFVRLPWCSCHCGVDLPFCAADTLHYRQITKFWLGMCISVREDSKGGEGARKACLLHVPAKRAVIGCFTWGPSNYQRPEDHTVSNLFGKKGHICTLRHLSDACCRLGSLESSCRAMAALRSFQR